MKQQISSMLELQDSMNSVKVKADWREQNFEWYRAIYQCVELLDHHGWKWWKSNNLTLIKLL